MTSFIQDLRFALRSMARRPAFTGFVVATIALGVGANAAIFSVVNSVLLRPLPYPDPDRVVAFGHTAPTWLVSPPELLDYQRDLRSFEKLAAYTQGEGNLTGDAEPERVASAAVSQEFFDVLSAPPQRGRYFATGDDRVIPAPIAIISHALWQRRFGGADDVVGRSFSFNGFPRTIIGVMPPNFDYPSARTDVWLPMRPINPDSPGDRANHNLFVVGRLKPGTTVDAALTEASQRAARMMREHAGRYDPNQPLMPTIARVSDTLVGQARPYLWALLGAVAFVMLIVCANVANLLLARGEGRRKEMALRTALGASRGRLLGQLLTESAALALAGGALGLLIAWAGSSAIAALAPSTIPRLDEIRLDWTVFAFAAAVAMAAGLLFGLAPALRGARHAPAEMLKEGGKTTQAAGSRLARRSLVIAEVALSVIMLSGAGMLLRSLANLQHANIGFVPDSVFTAKVSPQQTAYNEQRTVEFYRALFERIRALPGVRAAGGSGWIPVAEVGGLWGLLAEGQSYDRVPQGPTAVPQQVTPGWFGAMGIPLLRGRDFSDDDRSGGPYVAIVSTSLARRLWQEDEPLGKRLRLGGGQTFMTVVGVVPDILDHGFADTPEPQMYFPLAQTAETAYFMPRALTLMIRTAGDPLALERQVRDIVRSLDGTIPLSAVRTLDDVVGSSVASRRFSTLLLGGFAVLALLLAGIGIYGVVSYGVSERQMELGIRMALGAEQTGVLRLVISDGLRMTLGGIALGLAGSIVVARLMRSLLVGVSAVDVPTLALVSLALALVSLVASALPARRAVRIDPVATLRGG